MTMLHKIDEIDNWVLEIIKDDPVRPELSADFRIGKNSEMFALWDEQTLGAVCCVYYTEGIPGSIEEMKTMSSEFADTVVFYTIWSYERGSGRTLINQASSYIKDAYMGIKNVVTLSPKTEMAEKFHLKNGAWRYRENHETINYAYELNESLDRK